MNLDFGFLAAYPRVLLEAALLTVALSLAAFIGGGLIGLAVATLRLLGGRLVSVPLGLIVDVVRGTPLLVQLLIWYLGASVMKVDLSPFGAAAVALSVNAGAFISEILRGAVLSLPKGQRESALVLGLSRRYSLRAIELPQAMAIVLPALVSFYIGLIKDTSVAYIVGLHEILRTSQFIADFERRPLEIYLAAGLMYFCLCFPLSRLAPRLEARVARSGIVQARLGVQ